MDNQIRMQVARAVYGFPSLNRYAIDPAKPIRIAVQNGNVALYGDSRLGGRQGCRRHSRQQRPRRLQREELPAGRQPAQRKQEIKLGDRRVTFPSPATLEMPSSPGPFCSSVLPFKLSRHPRTQSGPICVECQCTSFAKMSADLCNEENSMEPELEHQPTSVAAPAANRAEPVPTPPSANLVAAEPAPAEDHDHGLDWIFIGPQGLRAGWSVFLFFILSTLSQRRHRHRAVQCPSARQQRGRFLAWPYVLWGSGRPARAAHCSRHRRPHRGPPDSGV